MFYLQFYEKKLQESLEESIKSVTLNHQHIVIQVMETKFRKGTDSYFKLYELAKSLIDKNWKYNKFLETNSLGDAFQCSETRNGHHFWRYINESRFNEFFEVFPEYK